MPAKTESRAIPSFDVVVIGGGQAGLACGYFLRRYALRFVILDGEQAGGGAWQHMWASLRTFSPARWSSLPGWRMPEQGSQWPHRDEVIDYLRHYEQRYQLPVKRPVTVHDVTAGPQRLHLATDHGEIRARAVINATGSWHHPYIPAYPGQQEFRGRQWHTVDYDRPEPFRGRRVLVVGGGNSGAQLMAELATVAEVSWVTFEPPRFLPESVDGRVLFERASALWRARQSGEAAVETEYGLGDIVQTPAVHAALKQGRLGSVRPFRALTESGVIWPDGTEEAIDDVIWCTGFRPALNHLAGLGVQDDAGRVAVEGNRSSVEPRLWLVGHGNWTGFASATLMGVMRSARQASEGSVRLLGAKRWRHRS
ncbi:pyridine nucleotide-disulfide oxidoreductase [Kushneria sinocarnis]|uniref:Pyridine nucleotide-disulfide oxidoreductase n=1 Tax=Kushneria sinocarnis TaxID=595502 RepID=A0A420X1L5_9GAMM|nr:ArsO family NAD(P)H-dependent flavin-containing monooxygenase [Kushneria sinocarnis]RKR07674.1 pyridine nucleotide-disulfide oxidoreductase [Kushneria sinocarnis]